MKTNPSRSTVTPVSIGTGLNIGPAYAHVWNSPRSPHGSIAGGSSASSAASNSRPGKRAIDDLRVEAGDPRAQAGRNHLARERRACRRRRAERAASARAREALFAIAPDVFEEQIAEGDMREPSATARATAAAIARSYTSFGHGDGIGICHSGSPSASACACSTSTRTACIATRCAGFVDRRQQPANLDVAALPQHVHHPGAVLAAAPRHQRLHLNSSG